MKNFKITAVEDGKEYWISRSVAVSVFLFVKDKDQLYVLANKRGPGAADFQGLWNCPCGYLDWDETAKEAACREVFEECGVKINPKMLTLHNVITDPTQNRQNVTLRFCGMINKSRLNFFKSEGGEENEVSEVALIPFSEISKYKWAFGHDEIIQTIYLDEFY